MAERPSGTIVGSESSAASGTVPAGLWIGAGGVGIVVLATLALRADLKAPDTTLAEAALDVGVGVAFAVAAGLARGSAAQRAWVLAVGASWLLASISPSMASVHQGALAITFLAFPSGRVRRGIEIVVAAAAGLVALGAVPQLGAAAVFALVAVLRAAGPGGGQHAYPALGAATVGIAIALSWSTNRFELGALDPGLALVVYELVLLAIAGAFPLAARRASRARERLTDEVVSDLGLSGIEGLAIALRSALGDPAIDVYLWDATSEGYVEADGRPAERDDRRWLPVDGSDGPLAVVAHRSAALDDPPTASAVVSATRLTVTNARLRDELRERRAELEASRARMLAATDRTRRQVAEELRDDVDKALRRSSSDLASLPARDPEARTALDVAARELGATSALIADLVSGVPPADLGDGRLRVALAGLAGRSPVLVTLLAGDDVAASAEAEGVLYYVVSEALTNAIKHAVATRIAVEVRRDGGAVTVSVSDNGRGGADPSGSGLQGLADRVSSARGRLRVESPPGAGTKVIATVPG